VVGLSQGNTTLHGRAHVGAIVVRLDPSPSNRRAKYPDHFIDSLFTIDEAGGVVGHAPYSGQILSGLFGTLGKAIIGPAACKREEKGFLRGLSAPPCLHRACSLLPLDHSPQAAHNDS
jgi:hypothetical protein